MKNVSSFVLMMILAGLAVHAQQMDALLIHGQGFSFWVKEPKGWTCHTEDAGQYRLNAYFCVGENDVSRSPAIMHITVYGKGGVSIQDGLTFDAENYKQHAKKIEFLEFPIGELKYECASKVYVIDDKTTDYVCFLDPGKELPLYVALVLHGPKEVSPKYEKDFLALIKSFHWLTTNVLIKD